MSKETLSTKHTSHTELSDALFGDTFLSMLLCPLFLSSPYFKIMRLMRPFCFFSASHMKIGYSCYRLKSQAFYVVLLLQFIMRMFLTCRL